jgi:hypothetical protein
VDGLRIPLNAPKAANFPGYVNCDYSSVSCSDLGMQHSITEGPNRFPVLKRQTNGSPLPIDTMKVMAIALMTLWTTKSQI